MKRSSALTQLSREHHQALVFSKRIREIFNAPADKQLQQWLAFKPAVMAALLPHFEEEEHYFLHELGASPQHPLMQRMLQEHQSIREFVNTEEVQTLGAFSQLLMAHVRFEERELFPWLEETYALT